FLCYAALTAADLPASLLVKARYYRMRNRQYRLHYEERDDGATLSLHGVQASHVLQHHAMFEIMLTGIAQNDGTVAWR
ncbi:AraC family transcriptional regulator, partial [Burkholderia pseudomallei]